MSRYEWIKCEELEKVEKKVWRYVWEHKKERNKDKNVEPPYSFSVKLKNYDELYVVTHALIILSKNMLGKTLPHQHTENVKPQMIKEAKAFFEKLYKQGIVGEALDHMSEVIAELKQKNISTADEFAVKISNYVYNELCDRGASKKRAKDIKSFIKSAMIAIVKDRQHYEADFFALVQNLRCRNIKPLPMQTQIKLPLYLYIHSISIYNIPCLYAHSIFRYDMPYPLNVNTLVFKIKQPQNFLIQRMLTLYTPPISTSISTYSYF